MKAKPVTALLDPSPKNTRYIVDYRRWKHCVESYRRKGWPSVAVETAAADLLRALWIVVGNKSSPQTIRPLILRLDAMDAARDKEGR